ncbi:hypothetical protein MKX01_008039 [Papaver californicum]|nr:hypothetical protein MKX01_008039 [Papaver californicum]
MIGVGAPLFAKYIPALHPDRDVFVIVKAFAAGIFLATGFMNVLPDSFDMLTYRQLIIQIRDIFSIVPCLSDNPWHKFPFTGFVAMLSAIVTLMVDSIATSFYTTKNNKLMIQPTPEGDHELGNTPQGGAAAGSHFHSHGHHHGGALSSNKGALIGTQLLRYISIVVHSIVIGLAVGASNNTCTIKPLVAALCFHQMFEGMGLGGCIMQKFIIVFFFSITTPAGIAVGMGLSKIYRENSPTALITVGLLNASSAGLLIYMAPVDLLAADFMGEKLQASIKLQIKSYIAVLLGAGGMSLMAKWA